MTELEEVREEFKKLILETCNVIGCEFCTLKWVKDKDGNSCRSDVLQNKEMDLEYGS